MRMEITTSFRLHVDRGLGLFSLISTKLTCMLSDCTKINPVIFNAFHIYLWYLLKWSNSTTHRVSLSVWQSSIAVWGKMSAALSCGYVSITCDDDCCSPTLSILWLLQILTKKHLDHQIVSVYHSVVFSIIVVFVALWVMLILYSLLQL